MGRLRNQERIIARNEARRNGNVGKRHILTPEEQQKLDSQEHTWLSDFSPEEQAKFETERNEMWAKIPEHLRGKAEKLAGNAN